MDTASTDDKLSIEVKKTETSDGKSDMDLLTDLASVQYRTPGQQAAAFVHDALEAYRARQARGDSGTPAKLTGGAAHRARQVAA